MEVMLDKIYLMLLIIWAGASFRNLQTIHKQEKGVGWAIVAQIIYIVAPILVSQLI